MKSHRTLIICLQFLVGLVFVGLLVWVVMPRKISSSLDVRKDENKKGAEKGSPRDPEIGQLESEIEKFESAAGNSPRQDEQGASALLGKCDHLLSTGRPLNEVEPLIRRLLPKVSDNASGRATVDSLANHKSGSACLHVARTTWDFTAHPFPHADADLITNLRIASEAGYPEAKFLFGVLSVDAAIVGIANQKSGLRPMTVEWLDEASNASIEAQKFVSQNGMRGLFSPNFYLAVAHHIRAVELAEGRSVTLSQVSEKLTDTGVVDHARMESRLAEAAYEKSIAHPLRMAEKEIARLLEITLKCDPRIFSQFVLEGNRKDAVEDFERFQQEEKSDDRLSSSLVEAGGLSSFPVRVWLTRPRRIGSFLATVLDCSPSTQKTTMPGVDPGRMLREFVAKQAEEERMVKAQEAVLVKPKIAAPVAKREEPEIPKDPEPATGNLGEQTFRLVTGYLDACSGRGKKKLSEFVHPDGFHSFDSFLNNGNVDGAHWEYVNKTYERLRLDVMSGGTYQNVDGLITLRLPVAITGLKKDGQPVDMISYRIYQARQSPLGLRLVAEDSIVSFDLKKAGYSTSAPATGRVNTADGKLVLRYEPSRLAGEASVIKTLKNGDMVNFWPVPNPVFDKDEGKDIQWVIMLTDDHFGGLGSMRLLNVVTPAPRVY